MEVVYRVNVSVKQAGKVKIVELEISKSINASLVALITVIMT